MRIGDVAAAPRAYGLRCLDTFSREAVNNAFVRHKLSDAPGLVREGTAFHESMEKSDIVPPMAIDMIKVGEATGSLDVMLSSVSDYFDERVETRVQRLLTLVEPIMLIVMGVIVALLLISIYLPMFGALGQVGT